MTWATDSSDSFNRANSILTGESLDNGVGGSSSHAWAALSGDWSIVTNQAKETRSGAPSDRFCGVNLAVAVTDMRAAAQLYANDCGVVARMNGAGTQCYLAYRNWSTGKLQLFKYTSGSFTQLGADGAVLSNGDEVAVACIGTAISAEINGAVAIGPITDASYSSGAPGMYGGGGGTSVFDNFVYQIAGSGSNPSPARQYHEQIGHHANV